MSPNLELQISESALRHNLGILRSVVGDCCLIAPCLKGNAYGHGLEITAQVLDKAGADGFSVYTLAEAIRLQEIGITKPIIVLGPVDVEDAEEIVERDIRILIWDTPLLEAMNAVKAEHPARVHLAIDTGMSRFGVLWGEQAESLGTFALKLSNTRVEGVMTHFSSSDEDGSDYTKLQLQRFNDFVAWFKAAGGTPSIMHTANSAAALRFEGTRLQLIRPGRAIYGYVHNEKDPALRGLKFKQAIRAVSYIAQLKVVPKDTPVGYSQTFKTLKTTTVAVLPAGYAEGISRFLGNRGQVLVSGVRCPIIGKVCMNATMVDVSHLPDVRVGDEVVFLGAQGNENITTYEVAELQDTVPYNIITNFQDSLPRRLVE